MARLGAGKVQENIVAGCRWSSSGECAVVRDTADEIGVAAQLLAHLPTSDCRSLGAGLCDIVPVLRGALFSR
jgi:hypothetical protein